MKYYKVELTDKAKRDLYEIANYYIESDLDYYAEKLLHRIYTRIAQLSILPLGYRRYEPDSTARYVTIKHYYIFYEINEGTNTVSILRIIHQKRDLRQIKFH